MIEFFRLAGILFFAYAIIAQLLLCQYSLRVSYKGCRLTDCFFQFSWDFIQHLALILFFSGALYLVIRYFGR